MKKRLVIATMLVAACMCVVVGCKNTGKKEKKKESTMIADATATVEAYDFINEWDDDLFEVFGFSYLQLPAKAHYPSIEKGRTYLKGEFYVDTFEEFRSFFYSVYNVMWGAISDPNQVMKEENGIYSFDGEYVVNEIYRAASDDGYDTNKRLEKNAWIEVIYDSNERKATIECRLLTEPGQIKKVKEKESKKAEKKD